MQLESLLGVSSSSCRSYYQIFYYYKKYGLYTVTALNKWTLRYGIKGKADTHMEDMMMMMMTPPVTSAAF